MNIERDKHKRHEWEGDLSSGVKCRKCGAGPFFLARELKEQVYCQPKGE